MPFEIDDEDEIIVRHYSWNMAKGYVTTNIRSTTRRQQQVCLHQLLTGFAPSGMVWDHEDRNKLNNRRGNLRLATHQLNNRNRDARADNLCGVKGVYKFQKWWKAEIRDNTKNRVYLGIFDTLEEAAEARRLAEIKYWGTPCATE